MSSFISIPDSSPVRLHDEKLIKLAEDAQTTSFMAVAFFVLLVFDHLISMDKEVELVWKNPKPSLARYIYIWNRYFSLAIIGVCASVFLQQVDSDAVCALYARIRYIASTMIIVAVDCILMLRVWILFGKANKLLWALVPIVAGEAGVMLFVGDLTARNTERYVYASFINGCYSATALPSYFFVFALPSLLVGLVMFVLTVYNCHSKLQISFSSTLNVQRSWMPIATLFFRDGVYWFLAVLAVNPVQMLLWLTQRPSFGEVLMVPAIAVYSMIGSHSLLNLLGLFHSEIVRTTLPQDHDSGFGGIQTPVSWTRLPLRTSSFSGSDSDV